MPQRRRRAHGLSGRPGAARGLRLGLSGLAAAVLLAAPIAFAGKAAAADLPRLAAELVEAFPDEDICLFVPPEPIGGVFEPDGSQARRLQRDHDLARALDDHLRAATLGAVIALAPSEPFDAAMVEAGGPMLVSIMHRLLWLYADYWRAARSVVLDEAAPALPTIGLEPLRIACAPAVALFVFTRDDGSIEAAGYLSLLTGRLLASLPEGN